MDTTTNNIHILITAGGGGHFAPALAVIRQLEKHKNVSVLFVGRKYGFEGDAALSFEYQTVQKLGIPFKTITAGRLQRSTSFQSLMGILKLPIGLWQAFQIVKREKPDVILSFGGYVALPITVAGAVLKIPVVIHEQTMRAGLTNRISAKFAKKICISFENSKNYFSKTKTILTGNPLREELSQTGTKSFVHGSDSVIFITGGSLGSHAINVAIEGCLEKLLEKYQVIHQTGDAKEFHDFDRLTHRKERLPEKLQKRYYLTKFILPSEIAGIFKKASLVIGRAGITTVTELIYFNKPALLIPLPHGQRNGQLENANYLASLGLAVVRKQEDVTSETMYTEIVHMMDELGTYKLNRDPKTLIQKNAAEKIVTIVLGLTQKFSS